MKTNPAPKSHQAERSEAQSQSPLAEAPSEEISEARLNQLAKDYGPSIERAITAFNREIEHYLLQRVWQHIFRGSSNYEEVTMG